MWLISEWDGGGWVAVVLPPFGQNYIFVGNCEADSYPVGIYLLKVNFEYVNAD